MNKFIAAAVAASIALAAPFAFAAEAIGTLHEYNAAGHTLTLDGGKVFQVSDAVMSAASAKLEPGKTSLKVIYDMKDGKNVATEVIHESKN